jgi:hypothetical protein
MILIGDYACARWEIELTDVAFVCTLDGKEAVDEIPSMLFPFCFLSFFLFFFYSFCCVDCSRDHDISMPASSPLCGLVPLDRERQREERAKKKKKKKKKK